MQINNPFSIIEKITNIHKILDGTYDFGKNNTPKKERNYPLLTPKPIPNLTIDSDSVSLSRPKLTNMWNTEYDFPYADSDVCCWYCTIHLFDYVESDDSDSDSDSEKEEKEKEEENMRVTRWFAPSDRSKNDSDTITYRGYGVFCTYYCTYMYINNMRKTEETQITLKNLNKMFKDLYNQEPKPITNIVIREHLEKFGGTLSEFSYKDYAYSFE